MTERPSQCPSHTSTRRPRRIAAALVVAALAVAGVGVTGAAAAPKHLSAPKHL